MTRPRTRGRQLDEPEREVEPGEADEALGGSDALAPAVVVTEPSEPAEYMVATFNPPAIPPTPAPSHETTFVAPVPASEAEAGLLAALRADPDDVQTRLVYADWLEENGKLARSGILRFELKLHALAPEHPHVRLIRERLRQLVADGDVDAGWRAQVMRPSIEGCPDSVAARCPRRWSALSSGEQAGRRTCASCQRTVRFCVTYGDVAAAARQSARVVVDPCLEREEALQVYEWNAAYEQ